MFHDEPPKDELGPGFPVIHSPQEMLRLNWRELFFGEASRMQEIPMSASCR